MDTTGDRNRVLGEVDLFAAPLLVHAKAIYIHEGVQYHVDLLDWDERKAFVTRTDVDYYTDADLGITLKVLEVFDEADAPPAGKRQRGEVMVAWKVTMFKKIKYHTHENVGLGLDQTSPSRRCTPPPAGSCRPPSWSTDTTVTRSTVR